MTALIPLRKLYQEKDLEQHCKHILEHQGRYVPERVFEAKSELDNLKLRSKETNGCTNCQHYRGVPHDWCYMFKEQRPLNGCGQFTPNKRSA